MELPLGFRFHPTDEELITHYLSKKVSDATFDAIAIGEVDLNKCEPWDLPCRAKMGEKDWYFFCVRDRKYPTGLRTNRATECGYWKATGKDREIYRGSKMLVVGMKKTLVFYRGRAPKGEKSNWVMHEYRLMEANYYSAVYNQPKSEKNEWVICRVFNKSGSLAAGAAVAAGMRSMLNMGSSYVDEFGGNYNHPLPLPLPLPLPPLMDLAYKFGSLPATTIDTEPAAHHVTCFSINERAADELEEKEEENPGHHQHQRHYQQHSFVSDWVSPTSFFTSKMNMPGSNFLQCSNPIGSYVQLLQSSAWGTDSRSCKAEKESMVMSNISQETGLTSTDINTDISSVFSNNNGSAKQSLDAQEVPCTSSYALTPSLQLDECLWSY